MLLEGRNKGEDRMARIVISAPGLEPVEAWTDTEPQEKGIQEFLVENGYASEDAPVTAEISTTYYHGYRVFDLYADEERTRRIGFMTYESPPIEVVDPDEDNPMSVWDGPLG